MSRLSYYLLLTATAALLLFPRRCSSAPAIVWTKQQHQRSGGTPTATTGGAVHSSEEIRAADVLGRLLGADSNNNNDEEGGGSSVVVFLLERDNNRKEEGGGGGSERLSRLASEGKLPKISALYDSDGATVHHNVRELDTPRTLERFVNNNNNQQQEQNQSRRTTSRAATVDLDEYAKKKALSAKRQRELGEANVLIVKIGGSVDDYELIDSVVSEAVEGDDSRYASVVLAGIRSVDEVKRERQLLYRNKIDAMKETGRRFLVSAVSSRGRRMSRRLEDEGEGEGENNNQQNNNNNNNQDMSGVYYVSMTPNILAGLLFTFLFATVTWIGVSCMNQITGQDVYVSKMPSIGREA